MPLRPARLLSAVAVVVLAVGLCPARADDADMVKEKLVRAKKVYDDEFATFKKGVTDLLDRREDDARKAGNKKLVDQVKAERDRFEKSGELPTAYPAALQNQMRAARASFDKAYGVAVKELVRLKEDAEAEAVEKAQREFFLESALLFGKRTYLVTLKHTDVKVLNGWFSTNGTILDNKIKQNGEFVPHSIFLHPPAKGTSQVKYPLGGKWLAFRASVGVPKMEDARKEPDSALTFEVLGDGKSLWKSEPVAKMDEFQTCYVRIEKVKTLTLHAHCVDKDGSARAVWFEPVLIE